MEIMKETSWSKIRRQNSVHKELLEIVGNGKPMGSVPEETITVSATMLISVEKWHNRVRLRILSCNRMREMRNLHQFILWQPSECLFSRPRVVADLRRSALMHIVKLMNSRQKGLKRLMTKLQWLSWKMTCMMEHGNLLWTVTEVTQNEATRCQSWHPSWVESRTFWVQIIEQMTIGFRFSDLKKPIQCVNKSPKLLRHTKIRDQNPSLGYTCPGEPHQRNPNAPKFEDRSQEETEWKEQRARDATWKLSKSV